MNSFSKRRLLMCVLMAVGTSAVCWAQDDASDSPEEDFRITKGRYFSTFSFSLDHREAQNENQLLRFVIDQDRLNFRLVGRGGYAIADNIMLGVGLGYGRQREDITSENEDGEEVTARSVEQGYAVIPTFRTFIPVLSGRLQIIVQAELDMTFGESLERDFLAADVNKVTGNFFEGQFGVSPGFLLFFDRHWAFEALVGLAGLTTRVEEQVTNDDEANKTRIVQNGVDLRLNLLQLNLGVAYYF